MTFGGLQKLTLLDFPGMTACTVFTKGCNFACPFCHNASLVTHLNDAQDISHTQIIDFLKKRVGLLDGIAITGGEPLMHESLYDFIDEIRSMGYKIKLDTNGSFPDKIKKLIDNKMLDYIAMDIKNSSQKYGITAGKNGVFDSIDKSITLIMQSDIDYEFRTTVTRELHDASDFELIGKRVEGAKKYYLQTFKDTGDLISPGLHAMDENGMKLCLNILKKYVPHASIR